MNWDFSHVVDKKAIEPTEKQVDFANAIADMIHEDLPKEYTRQAYSKYIDDHIEEFRDEYYYQQILWEEDILGVGDDD